MTHNVHNQYRQMEAATSSNPNKLILMLYDGCLRFLHIADEAISKGETEKKAIHIGKALAIISELNSCLDRKLDDEIVPYLEAMYTHMMHKLLEANLDNDRGIIQHVYRLVANLRKNWVETVMNRDSETTAASPAPSPAPAAAAAPTAGGYGSPGGISGTPAPGKQGPLTFVA